VKYLLDINSLIALGHTSHVHHAGTIQWYRSVFRKETVLHTCSISELGFVRVSVQAGLQVDVPSARTALARLKASSKILFTLLPDDLGADRLPAYAQSPNKITDGHLLELARRHGAKLATLDAGIPGALLIPVS
jgi:predicted nucleic acid-binding protein